MLLGLIYEVTLANVGVQSAKIACLANPSKNVLYLGLIAFAVTGCSRGAMLARLPLLLIVLLPSAPTSVAALSNTLFLVHPPILYLSCIALAARAASAGSLTWFGYASLSALAMVLGGFWAMQELSWGGWWNWDVLECGVAWFWAVAVIARHVLGKSRSHGSHTSASLATLLLVYTTLNKLGIATSIHSFVSSASLRRHWPALLSLMTPFLRFNPAALLRAAPHAVLVCSYALLRWCYFLKLPVAALAASVALGGRSRNVLVAWAHAASMKTSLAILAANYCNSPYFSLGHVRQVSSTLSASTDFWGTSYTGGDRFLFLRRDMWLCKPRYSLSSYLTSESKRRPSPKLQSLAFSVILLKRYKVTYKKMQKRRIAGWSVIFFQLWPAKITSLFRSTVMIYFFRTTLIKLKFVKKFKKRFRKMLRRRSQSVMFYCKPNYLVHQKFKNARMGKGKGSPLVWVHRPVLNKPFAILSGFSELRSRAVMVYFKKHLSPHMYSKVR